MNSKRISFAVLLTVVVSCPSVVAVGAGFSFQGLGVVPGTLNSEAFAMSTDGSTVVGRSTVSGPGAAFRWTEGTGMVGLASSSVAYGVSADGSFVVGYPGFRWSEASGVINIPGIAFANGVSADGSIVTGFGSGGGVLRWTSATGSVYLGSGEADGLSGEAKSLSVAERSLKPAILLRSAGLLPPASSSCQPLPTLVLQTTTARSSSAMGSVGPRLPEPSELDVGWR